MFRSILLLYCLLFGHLFSLAQQEFHVTFSLLDLETKKMITAPQHLTISNKGVVILDSIVTGEFSHTFFVKKKDSFQLEVMASEIYEAYSSTISLTEMHKSHVEIFLDNSEYLANKIIKENEQLNKIEDEKYGTYNDLQTFEPWDPGFVDAEIKTWKIQDFIASNVVYPTKSRELGEQGKVYLEFIIEKDGSVSHVRILKGVSNLIDAEALKLVRKFPNFQPATLNGNTIRSVFRLPINFTLN